MRDPREAGAHPAGQAIDKIGFDCPDGEPVARLDADAVREIVEEVVR